MDGKWVRSDTGLGCPLYVTCANAPMFSVMAPPQKKLKGVIVILSLSLYGAGLVVP